MVFFNGTMDDVTRKIQITHEDVGSTVMTVIHVKGHPIIAYFPGTRYYETADEVAVNVLKRAFGPLLEQAIKAEANGIIVDPKEPWGSDD